MELKQLTELIIERSKWRTGREIQVKFTGEYNK